MRRLSLLPLLLLASACGGPIVAVTTETHDFTLTQTTQVVVRTYDGRITVTTGEAGKVSASVKKTAHGWSENEATKNLDNVVVTFAEGGATITIKAEPKKGAVETAAEVTLTVPPEALLDLGTSNGDVTTSGTTAEITANTSNGKVQFTGGQGRLSASSSNGNIKITPSGASLVTANTSNGSINFSGALVDGTSTFNTSNGGIDLTLPANATFHLDADTSNGSVGCAFPFTTSGTSGSELHADIGTEPTVTVQAHTSNGSIGVHKM